MEYYPWAAVRNPDECLIIACEEGGILGRKTPTVPITSIAQYVGRIATIVQKKRGEKTPRNWIALNTTFVTPVDFHISKDVRLQLFETGINAVERWLSFRKHVASMPAAPPASCGIPQPISGPHTSPSDRPSPDRTWDSRPAGSRPPSPSPSPDSRNGAPRVCRRWSL